MISFFAVYRSELLKIFKNKGVYILMAIIAGIFIFYAALFGMVVEQYNIMYPPEDTSNIDLNDVYSGIELLMEENQAKYEASEITLEEYEKLDYQYRANLASTQYMIDKGLDYGDFEYFLGISMVQNATLQNLITYCLSSAGFIFGIIATVLAAGMLQDEIKNGTMRLVLICPVGRTRLLMAKICAVMTELIALVGVMLLTVIIIGALMYNSSPHAVMLVFNAVSVGIVPFGVSVLLQLLALVVFIFMVVVFISVFTAVFRSKMFSIIVGIVLFANLLNTALAFAPSLGSFFKYSIFTNMEFSGFFSLSGGQGMTSFALALTVYLINLAVLGALDLFLFKIRDIN